MYKIKGESMYKIKGESMYKIIKEKKLETLEKKVATFINTMGCIPSGNGNKLEINGESMFIQAIYKKGRKSYYY